MDGATLLHYSSYVALTLSIAGCVWLLCASRNLPRYVFNRQLWQLALADLGLTCVDPIFETSYKYVPLSDSQLETFARIFRTLFHFFLCAVCLIELQVAGCVTACSLHSVRATKLIARMLPFAWAIALAAATLDASVWACTIQVTKHNGWVNVSGAAPVVTYVIGCCFCAVVVLYFTALFAVAFTGSPSSVVKQASWRALVFPAIFFVTMGPAWINYSAIGAPGMQSEGFFALSAVCIYSNGWINALAYALQHRRHLCRRRRLSQTTDSSARSRVSFHVAFGTVDAVSPMNSGVLPAGSLWDQFLNSDDLSPEGSMVEDLSTTASDDFLLTATGHLTPRRNANSHSSVAGGAKRLSEQGACSCPQGPCDCQNGCTSSHKADFSTTTTGFPSSSAAA
eukprot:TRINITY_DN120769_c0_g1_i1.p1 TRINITY_DN120769_c0_g1~~TRINITY_DN120769_c0_g1_i1.p1  ORF type:complete len:396 (-),score=42.00 TRINITY_DN120769_c0_g1_i1:345-1532(-)